MKDTFPPKMRLSLVPTLVTLLIATSLSADNNEANNKDEGLRYDPTWESLESRPLPSWFDESKIGIFIHWGVFSVPGFGGYEEYTTHYAAWFWNGWYYETPEFVDFMNKNYPPNWTYQDFASQFRAEFYDPYRWADIFKKAGAKYVVLTSKHHEGFSLYPSKYSFSWNAQDVGPNRDLVGDLAQAVRETTDLKFGLYHSRFEWIFANPLYKSDKESQFHNDEFVRFKTLPELYELVNLYQPEIVWSDGADDASSDYWKSKEFLAWLYNDSPVSDTVVSNDRWGNETVCKHGGFMTCSDNYNPGIIQPFKWENCMTLDKYAFAHRRNAKISDYRSPEEIIKVLTETVSCGGNLLVNVGPTADGIISPLQEERLLQLGEWLGINGEAIYSSVPWTVQNDTVTPGVWYTSKPAEKKVFAIVLSWPSADQNGQVHLGSVDPQTLDSVGILGSSHVLTWISADPSQGIVVSLPRLDENPSRWAWTVVLNQK